MKFCIGYQFSAANAAKRGVADFCRWAADMCACFLLIALLLGALTNSVSGGIAAPPFSVSVSASTNQLPADQEISFEVVVSNRTSQAWTIGTPSTGADELQLWVRKTPETTFKPLYGYRRIKIPGAKFPVVDIGAFGSFTTQAKARFSEGEYEIYVTFAPRAAGPSPPEFDDVSSRHVVISVKARQAQQVDDPNRLSDERAK